LRSGARKSGASRYQVDKDDEAVARARSVERREKAAAKAARDAAAGKGPDKDFAAQRRAKEAAKAEAAKAEAYKAGAAAAGGKKVAKPSA
jgi:hypothetical protein